MDVCGEIAHEIAGGKVATRDELETLKRRLSARAGLARVPTDAEVLAVLDPADRVAYGWLLRTKPSRTLSGVAVVAVMTPPSPCPHGRCAYCPGGVESGTPQSYTGKEPAARRGERWAYEGGPQVSDRLAQLAGAGHATDKMELVVMGGTFPARPGPEATSFLKGCLDVLNGRPSPDLSGAIAANEGGAHRCVALTLETRPDLCDRAGVDGLLSLGATRVEIGVQTTEDRALERVGRGHDTAASIRATRNLKDAGLKVGYHLMLGLPGMSREDDLAALIGVFEDPRMRPDLLKLYPTLVMPGTELHRWWTEGAYSPLEEEEAIELVAGLKARLPPWVRVSRVERDIPSDLIAAGVRASNLRQLVHDRLGERKGRCRCIRCREVGRRGTERVGAAGGRTAAPDGDDLELRRVDYPASGGEECFLSLELPRENAIVAYARVRLPSEDAWRPELQDAAVLRELRVVGEAIPLGTAPDDRDGSLQWQHRGLGRRLLAEVEARARGWGVSRLAVNAGMGARGYFRRAGYALEGPYMVNPAL